MLKSLRHRNGDASKSVKVPQSPSSFSKYKKPKKLSLVQRNQRSQFLVFIFIGFIVIAYIIAMSSFNDDSGNDQQLRTENDGGEAKSEVESRRKRMAYKWKMTDEMTPEGQQRLREEQEHIPKKLSELLPKMQYMKEKNPVVQKGKHTERNLFKAYSEKNRVQLDVKRDKKGKIVYTPITSIKKEDLLDMGYEKKQIDALGDVTYDGALKGRERLVDILTDAGVLDIAPEALAVLPKWSAVTKLYGDKPVILGLERCEEFRNQADPIDSSLGVSGMFNTGTNPMAMYVSNNCKMPRNRRDKAGGTRWQVPWGKHRLASQKLTNTAGHEIYTNKTNVLPIVLVRDPYTWMQSMCKNKYESRWPHNDKMCPNLAKPKLNKDGTPNKVDFKVNYKPTEYFDSLADYWRQWNKEYLEADYPRLIVRFEDIHFHARELIETICQCAGAVPREKDSLFRYVVDSAKWGAAHKSKSNMISAMVKYGSDRNRFKGMTESDWLVAKEVYSPELMKLYGYEMPEKLRESAQ